MTTFANCYRIVPKPIQTLANSGLGSAYSIVRFSRASRTITNTSSSTRFAGMVTRGTNLLIVIKKTSIAFTFISWGIVSSFIICRTFWAFSWPVTFYIFFINNISILYLKHNLNMRNDNSHNLLFRLNRIYPDRKFLSKI